MLMRISRAARKRMAPSIEDFFLNALDRVAGDREYLLASRVFWVIEI
jgi:hypothetical protein